MQEYKYNKLFLKLATKLPRSIEDLNPGQFTRVTSIMFQFNKLNTSKKLLAFVVLSKLRRWNIPFWFNILQLNDAQTLELADFAEFLFDKDAKCFKNLIPSIKVGCRKYSGPYMNMTNISWGTFRNASDYLTLFSQKKQNTFLNNMIALLYKPTIKDDNNIKYQKRVRKISRVKLSVKLAVYHNFMLMLNTLPERFPEVFKRYEKETQKKKKPKPQYWNDFMAHWMDNKVEDYHKKDDMPMLTILGSLNNIFKENKRKKK